MTRWKTSNLRFVNLALFKILERIIVLSVKSAKQKWKELPTKPNKQKIIKWKLKLDEIGAVKKKKLNIWSCRDNLKEDIINEI